MAKRGAEGLPRFALVTERFQDIEIIGQLSGGIPQPSARHGANAMAFADHDGDGDLDFFWGDFFEPGVLFMENTGSCAEPRLRQPPLQLHAANDSLLTSGYNVPTFADVDGDGDRDLVVGESSGELNFLRNTGTRTAPQFTLVSEAFGAIDAGRRSIPSLHDYDGDGDLDLVVGREDAGILAFRNQDGDFLPDPALRLPLQQLAAPAWGDLDGDGRPELIAGTLSGGLLYFRAR